MISILEGHRSNVHKKKTKNLKENYRPISLLPILVKIFENVLFCLITSSQSLAQRPAIQITILWIQF